jgi:type II secretory pathway component GspD/PulD (secretin)
MRRSFLFILFFILIFIGSTFSQDNIYGDYLISTTHKTISLDLERANLVDVLKMLSQQTGLNFISTEAVRERKITLYMENVPLKEAMDTIFKANNLTYDYYPEANIFVVKEMGKPTIELKAKVYYLKYARVKSSRLEKEIKNKMTEEDSEEETSTEEGTQDTIKSAVEKVLSEFGKVTEDPITNSLIVVDVPSQFPIIDEVINKLDIPLPRVMIEVEMLDVSKNLIDKLGFKFGTNSVDGLYATYTGGSRTSVFPFPHRLAGTQKGSLTLGTLDLSSFGAIMQFLTKDSSTKFLARPKILTLSNETAEVNLTVNEAIGVTTTTTEGGNTTQEVEREETGTKLRVTPQVNPYTKEITLFVEISNKETKESTLSISGLTSGKLQNPEERGTRSVVRLKDGETLIIGGLIRREKENTVTKVPLLGDLPVIGKFFSFKDKNTQERELLVFLTPHIIKDKTHLAKTKIFNREQADSLRRESIKVALEKFSK